MKPRLGRIIPARKSHSNKTPRRFTKQRGKGEKERRSPAQGLLLLQEEALPWRLTHGPISRTD